MTRPPSIVRFEQFYLGYWLIGIVNVVMTWDRNARLVESTGVNATLPGYLWWTTGIGLLIPVALWYFIARRGSVVAKWILTVLFGLAIAGLVFVVATGRLVTGLAGVLSIASIVLQGAALAMLFRPDTRPWFGEVAPANEETGA